MKKAFTLFLCIGLIALITFSPSLILKGIHTNVYRLREEELAEKFKGSLTLWHVVSFKTGGESGVSFLKSRIQEFEKKNPYVFIDLLPLTVDEAEDLLAQGERPDILSFPLGFVEDTGLLSALPAAENLLKAYASTGVYSGVTYAYPYMADFYTLTCNQDMFFYTDTSVPLDTTLSRELFFTMMDKIGPYAADNALSVLTLTDASGLTPKAAFLFLRDDGGAADDPGLFSSLQPAGAESFLNGKSAMYVSPAAEAQKLLSDKRAGALSIRSYAFSDYTDMVQLVGVTSGLEEKRQAMGADFAAYLLSERAQAGVEKLKLLPVISLEEMYQGDPLYMQEYEAMGSRGVVPNAFYYFQNREKIASAAELGLNGSFNKKNFLFLLGL